MRFFGAGAAAGAGAVLASPGAASAATASLGPLAPAAPTTPAAPTGFLTAAQRATLAAAAARLVPASGPGDWSAADLGAVDYIDNLLAGFDRDPATGAIYPGGPTRVASGALPGFLRFRPLSRVKALGWRNQVGTWRALYASGIAALDASAFGSFAAVPSAVQDTILERLDLAGSPFFAALFDHVMEGTYAHPVYGGNKGYGAWQWLGFAGDVHGVRFPTTGSTGAWTVYGGYSPEEMAAPGSPATEQPVATPAPVTQW
jgi:gluconate 2-dehydrogenase gamma chain